MEDAGSNALENEEIRARLGGLLEYAPDGIVVVDQEGRILLANTQTEALFGYPREELLGRSIEMLLPERLHGMHVSHRARYATESKTRPMGIGMDLVARRRDGSEFPVEISLSPLKTDKGLLVTGIVRDITERKRAEEVRAQLAQEQAARAEAERTARMLEKLRAFTDAAMAHLSLEDLLSALAARARETMEADAAVLLLAEPEGDSLVVRASSGLGDGETGFRVPAGRGFSGRVAAERRPLAVEETGPETVLDPRIAAAGIRSLLGAPLRLEDRVVGVLLAGSRRGQVFGEEASRLLQLIADRAALAIEQARLYHAARREIAERERAEAQLRDSEARLRAVLDTAADGILTIDERGTIELFNPAAERIFGYHAEEALGQNIAMLMPSPHAEEHEDYLARFLQTGERRVIGPGRELRGQRKDGTEFPLDLAVSEVRLGGRRLFTGIVRDLTERYRVEQQLLQAQKMEGVGRLAGGVAHDFNNLLTAILGYTELALDSLPHEDISRDYMENIERAALRAADLTRQLLTFARRQIIEPKVVDLNDLILETDRMLRRLIGEDIELVTLPKPDLWAVTVDPGQMAQIIVNLAVNARDAMPAGGKLTIETDNVALDAEYARVHPEVLPGDYVLLAISDTGAGMTEEVKAHLFEPFFTTKALGKGTGLGLATCYGIVKQSGGHIWFYSEEGRGTTFKIYLPRALKPGAARESREGPPELPGGEETILLAEDEPMVRDIGARALRAQGYTVLEAVTGEAAMRAAQAYDGPIHLLVTDVVMPQMGGPELAQRLAAERPDIRVLFASGYTDNAIVQHGIVEQGVAFLHKPFTPAAIVRKVRETLDAEQAWRPDPLEDAPPGDPREPPA